MSPTRRLTALPAKLTRPQGSAVLPRARLFRLLDRSGSHRLSWIGAPAGAGKTMFASSWIEASRIGCLWLTVDAGDADPATLFHYLQLAAPHRRGAKTARWPVLTPEFLPGLEVFARRFFERLFGLFDTDFAIVLDNCHEVPAASPPFGVILAALIDSLPEHGQLLLMSRSSLPAPLARWRMDPAFREIKAEDLRFTDVEAVALAEYVAPAVAAEAARTCNQSAQGWAAGLKLLLSVPPAASLVPSTGADSGASADAQGAREALFDYFAHEVLQRSSEREVLLRSSVLIEMEGETVAALTGYAGAAALLVHWYDERLFIERRALPAGPSYQFHPLFRDFLQARLARDLGAEAVRALKSRAASLLEDRGQLEAATLLAFEGDDVGQQARLILRQAPQLFAQGRLVTLDQWLQRIPDSTLRGDGWLLYWLGAACIMRDPALACASQTQAYERFQEQNERLGTWLAVASLITSHFRIWGASPPELERWIDAFERLRAQNGGSIPQAIELRVLTLSYDLVGYQPEHPLARHLIERAQVLAPTLSDPEQRCGLGAMAIGALMWRGDEGASRALIEQLQPARADEGPAGLGAIAFAIWHGNLLWLSNEHARALEMLSAARERGRRAGLTILDWNCTAMMVLCSLNAGDIARADQLTQEAIATLSASQTVMLSASKAMQALVHALSGRPSAGALAREALADRTPSQAPTFAALERTMVASALLEAGELEEACRCAAEARDLAARLPSDRWMFDAEMVWARAELERGAEREAVDHLRVALRIAAGRDYRSGISLCNPLRSAHLLALALRHGIESDYVPKLIRRRRLAMPPEPDVAPLWPVRLRLRTLGGFEVRIDDQPLRLMGRAARKPLEVLWALAGLGPAEIGLQTLAMTLWPELDGDGAHNACHVAIYRLRKLLGADEAVRVTHGRASLDLAGSWVDAYDFRQLTERIRAALSAGIRSRPDAEKLAAALVSSYPGHFLPAEQRSWAVEVREQLHSRFVRAAGALGAALEQLGAFEAAIELNRHGIELDAHAEIFHRGLLRAYLALGHKAEALEAYRRCRDLLRAGLGVEPSPEMRELHARIRDL